MYTTISAAWRTSNFTAVRSANVGPFTAETVIDSITVPLVSGRRYEITSLAHCFSSVADGYLRCRLREDSIAGTQISSDQMYTATVANQSFPLIMKAIFVAATTANKTFVATVARQVGTGNITAFADGTTQSFMHVLPLGW